jgi:hypothetical protein
MAADAFNQEYAMSIRDCRLAGLPNQPAGVELSSYVARASAQGDNSSTRIPSGPTIRSIR